VPAFKDSYEHKTDYVVYVIDVGHTTDRWLVGILYLNRRTEPVLRDRKIGNGTFSVGKEFMTAGLAQSVYRLYRLCSLCIDCIDCVVSIDSLRAELPGFLIPAGASDFLFSRNLLDRLRGVLFR
jgi:hypothetical protein